MSLRIIGLSAILAAIIGAGWFGYQRGAGDCTARHNAERLARIEAGQKLEAARIDALRQRDDLARQLEDAAHAEPVSVPECLGPSRVRRLNAIR